jgi:hypothetical protein
MPDPLIAAAALVVVAGLWLWATAGALWEAVHRG